MPCPRYWAFCKPPLGPKCEKAHSFLIYGKIPIFLKIRNFSQYWFNPKDIRQKCWYWSISIVKIIWKWKKWKLPGVQKTIVHPSFNANIFLFLIRYKLQVFLKIKYFCQIWSNPINIFREHSHYPHFESETNENDWLQKIMVMHLLTKSHFY